MISCAKRNVICAIFSRLLRNRSGIAESFEQKRTRFNDLIRAKYAGTQNSMRAVEIRRYSGFDFVKEAFDVLDRLSVKSGICLPMLLLMM